MIWWADVHSFDRVKCLYTFPTGTQLTKFLQTRLKPVLESSDYYRSITNLREDSMARKKIRNSFLTFASAGSSKQMESQDIDFLSMDEFDRVQASAETSAMESLESSKYKVLRKWSTPTIPDYGIHKLFEQSDQHQYMHKCDACNEWQVLDFEKNIKLLNPDGIDLQAKTIEEGSYDFVCHKCDKRIDRWYNGRWVAKFPERTKGGRGTRGYQISQMNAVWLSATEIKRKEIKYDNKSYFYNYVLGYPYLDKNLSVTESDITSSMRENLPEPLSKKSKYKYISIGIDWGKLFAPLVSND